MQGKAAARHNANAKTRLAIRIIETTVKDGSARRFLLSNMLIVDLITKIKWTSGKMDVASKINGGLHSIHIEAEVQGTTSHQGFIDEKVVLKPPIESNQHIVTCGDDGLADETFGRCWISARHQCHRYNNSRPLVSHVLRLIVVRVQLLKTLVTNTIRAGSACYTFVAARHCW